MKMLSSEWRCISSCPVYLHGVDRGKFMPSFIVAQMIYVIPKRQIVMPHEPVP
jgi:hypothetical protein